MHPPLHDGHTRWIESLPNAQMWLALAGTLVATLVWLFWALRPQAGSRTPRVWLMLTRGFWNGQLGACLAHIREKYPDMVVRPWIWGLGSRARPRWSLYYAASAEPGRPLVLGRPAQALGAASGDGLRGFARLYHDRLARARLWPRALTADGAVLLGAAYDGLLLRISRGDPAAAVARLDTAVAQHLTSRLEYWASVEGGALEDALTYFRKPVLAIVCQLAVDAAAPSASLGADVQAVERFVTHFMRFSPIALTRDAVDMIGRPVQASLDRLYAESERDLAALAGASGDGTFHAMLFLMLAWADRVLPTWLTYTLWQITLHHEAPQQLGRTQLAQYALESWRLLHCDGPFAIDPIAVDSAAAVGAVEVRWAGNTAGFSVNLPGLLLWDRANAYSSASVWQQPQTCLSDRFGGVALQGLGFEVDDGASALGLLPQVVAPGLPLGLGASLVAAVLEPLLSLFDVGFELESFPWMDQIKWSQMNHSLVYGLASIADQLRGPRRVGFRRCELGMWYLLRQRASVGAAEPPTGISRSPQAPPGSGPFDRLSPVDSPALSPTGPGTQ